MSPMRFFPTRIACLALFVLLAMPLSVSGQSKPAAKKPADQMGSMSSGGGSDAVKDELKKMETERSEAVIKGDTATLDKTTTDDYVLTDVNGKASHGKAAMIERIKSGDIKITSNKLDDLAVYVYGNAAVVTGTSTVTGTMAGHSVNDQQLRFTRLWVKRNGRWMSAAFQQTAVAK